MNPILVHVYVKLMRLADSLTITSFSQAVPRLKEYANLVERGFVKCAVFDIYLTDIPNNRS